MKSTGWKGIVGGIGTMLVGVVGIMLNFILPDSDFAMSFPESMAAIMLGLSALGIRLKLNG